MKVYVYLPQMPSNIEIKARVSDADKLLNKVLKFSDTPMGAELLQEDTFFNVTRGRLKLRQLKVNKLSLQDNCFEHEHTLLCAMILLLY